MSAELKHVRALPAASCDGPSDCKNTRKHVIRNLQKWPVFRTFFFAFQESIEGRGRREREKDSEREQREKGKREAESTLALDIFIYIYTYIYIQRDRERKRERERDEGEEVRTLTF